MNELKEIIEIGRANAVAAVDELMVQTFEAIHESMENWKEETGEVLTEKAVCGLSKQTLRQIADRGPDHLIELSVGPDRSRLLMEFLNINSLRMKEIRAKYPNAYVKWDAKADAQLLEERRRGASLGQLSKTFGRNLNAIKIRLELLGAGDAETADAAMHYTSRRKLVTDVNRQEH